MNQARSHTSKAPLAHPLHQFLASAPPLTNGGTMIRTDTNLGDLISTCYQEFLAMYGDEELASVATAAVINDLLTAPARSPMAEHEAA